MRTPRVVNSLRYHDDPILQPCGHPLAARMIVATGKPIYPLQTVCWACRIVADNTHVTVRKVV